MQRGGSKARNRAASGFVGMLAKGKLGSGDSHMPELLLSGEAGKPPARPKYQLRMAREVPPVRPAQAASVPAANASAKAGDAAGDAVGCRKAKKPCGQGRRASPRFC